jgi:hypothetical protein
MDKETDNDLLIRIDEHVKDIYDDIKEIKKTLHGNGQEGLCDTVKEHDTTIKNIKYGITLGFIIISIVFLIANYFKI